MLAEFLFARYPRQRFVRLVLRFSTKRRTKVWLQRNRIVYTVAKCRFFDAVVFLKWRDNELVELKISPI